MKRRPPTPLSHLLHLARLNDGHGLLDYAVCPRCRAPMVARLGRHGPYFHCLCVTKEPEKK